MSDFRPPIGTTIKLNGSNYMLWSRAFLLFLGSQKKKSHVQTAPPATTDANYDTWYADDYSVMTWLLNSLEPAISQNIMYLDSAKAMWDALREMFFNDKNVSRVFELYEKLFSHTQDTQSVNDYFSTLKGLADEILVYHLLSCDATTRAKQWEEFMVAKFLSAFFVSPPGAQNPPRLIIQLCLLAVEVRMVDVAVDRDVAEVEDEGFMIDYVIIVVVRIMSLISVGRTAFAVSPGKSWMLDSGASTHITGTKSLLTSFSPSSLPYVRLADGNYSLVTGTGVVKPTTHITLDNVLFAPNFPDLQKKRTIGGGHERGGLYYLDTVSPVSPSALSAAVFPYQWHCRLGHPSSASLRSLVPVAMPSSVLHGDIPFSCLHPDKPLYHIPPRIFGYVTFFEFQPYFTHSQTKSTSQLYPTPLPAQTFVSPMSSAPPASLLQVYTRRHRPATTPEAPEIVPTVSCPLPQSSSPPASEDPPPSDELPIAIRKVIPTSYQEALKHPLWRAAMDEEMRTLLSRGTWILPVYQLDVKNAFLYGDLTPTVFMEQPPGYVAQGEDATKVCCLKKAIYGLKQSPKAWFDKFSSVLGTIGFKQCKSDHSVFVRHQASGIVILIVYVDDILISGSDVRGIEETKKYLQQHFVIKDLGRPKYFLGIEIAHENSGVSLSQQKYATDLLKETGLLGAKPVDTPMEVDPSVWDDSGEVLEDKAKYRRLVGKLIYLTVTRPDISFVVGLVSRFLDKPKQVHWDAAIRILQYVKKSPGNGLLFKKNVHLKIEGYSDADYAGSKPNRKSTSGYCTYLGGNPVTWRTKKQHIVARSSAEAEYRAMAHTATEMIGVKNLLGELGFTFNEPLPMHCDNHAAIYIANNPVFHERTKHIEVDCHFIRECVLNRTITTPFTSSSNQIADIFTKPLPVKRFSELCTKLDLINIYDPA
ncbi:uncharacterized protein LOC121801150 [Salvia splendens]|uniref:uncharacterized protein LOC121801150 n=1 Tax=Salvia splendens TaxID=180675 RepID=UPI001C277A18|nr:uncharacterized protein LOC121801150 [Salvia splendens]